jgi:hypothetical protein
VRTRAGVRRGHDERLLRIDIAGNRRLEGDRLPRRIVTPILSGPTFVSPHRTRRSDLQIVAGLSGASR